MKATTKKIYSLASAILMVVLSVLLLVGALLPIFKVNMANIEVAEGFEKGHFTEGLIVDEAKVGFGGLLKLLKNKKYVSVINTVQHNEQKIRRSLRTYSTESVGYADEQKKIEQWQKEIDTTLDSLTDADYEAMRELFLDEDFIEALYLEIGFVSIFADVITQGNDENYIYASNNSLAIFTMIFGMIFLAGFIICMLILAIISLFSALKKLFALATGFKHLDLKKLESLYPGKTLTALMPALLFFILAKATMGSKLVLGAGMVLIFVCFIAIALLRAANKIILRERRNPKHIARVLVGLLSCIFALCIFNSVSNMNLIEAYYRSNDIHVEEAYEAAKEAAYAENIANLNLSNITSAESIKNALESAEISAKHTAEEHVTKILTKNALHLLAAVLLVSIFAFVLLSLSLNRLRENIDDFKSSYGAERYGAHYVVAALLLLCVLFTGTLGVSTVEERDQAYLDGGVKILWNDYTLADSGTKEEYDFLVELHADYVEQIKEFEEELEGIDDEEEKAELTFELAMAKRYANKMALRIETLKNDDTARRTGIIIMLAVVIVLEILYKATPSLIDKFLPDGVKRFLAGNDDADDTSMGGTPAYAAPASAPAPAPAPAPASYSAPAKAKSFDKEESSTPQGGASNGDDLADEMQRMFDNR